MSPTSSNLLVYPLLLHIVSASSPTHLLALEGWEASRWQIWSTPCLMKILPSKILCSTSSTTFLFLSVILKDGLRTKDYHTATFLHFPAPSRNQRWGLLISRYEHLDPRSIAMWWMGTFKLLWPNENANGSTPVCVIHQQSWEIFALPVWNCDWFELKS